MIRLLGKITFAIIAVFLSISPVVSAGESDTLIISPKDYALGGLHAADSGGLSTLYANPGSLNAAKSGFTFAGITAKVKGPVFTITSLILEGIEGDMNSILTSSTFMNLLKGLYAGAQIDGPIRFGYIGKGLGFAIMNTSSTVITGSTVTGVKASINERFILSGGYAFRIPLPEKSKSTLDIGFTLKSFLKGSVNVSSTLFGLPSFLQNISPDTLLTSPFTFSAGIGIDAGIRYSFADTLSFGLVCRDLFVPTVVKEYSDVNAFLDNEDPVTTPAYPYLPQNLTAGVSFTPSLGLVDRFISDLKLMLDYRDILDFIIHPATMKNFLLKFGFGVEVTLLEILKLRGGFSEGLFSAGFGIDLAFFTLNAAMYGTERSLEPGLKPLFNAALGFELTF